MYYESFMISASDRNVVRSYIANTEYEGIKKAIIHKENVPLCYDYYSDYYLYYSIAYKQECERSMREH